MFGGLYQEYFLCKCGQKAEMPMKSLPNTIPIPLINISVQKCLDQFLAREEMERKCENCDSQWCSKTMSIVIEPTTLILLLIRYKFDQTRNETIKIQNPVICEKTLALPSGTIYTLNSTINHIGETTDAGHYYVVLHENEKKVMLDDANVIHDIVLNEEMALLPYILTYSKNL